MKKLLFIFIIFIVGCASSPKVEWINVNFYLEEQTIINPYGLIADSFAIDSLKNRIVIVGLKEDGSVVWRVKEE